MIRKTLERLRQPLVPSPRVQILLRVLLFFVFLPLVAIVAILFNETRQIFYESSLVYDVPPPTIIAPTFPVGVNPKTKSIEENPVVDVFLESHLAISTERAHVRHGYVRALVASLADYTWFQNIAAGGGRMLLVRSGERKEEIAERFARLLGWNETEKKRFLSLVVANDTAISDGKFFPWTYIVEKDATAEDVASLVLERFTDEILERYDTTVASIVPLQDAVIIASMLEREAYDFTDMRYISGVMWNRLFIGMNLQIDATLQYAKGKRGKTWWSRVVPQDKFIESPYNTYKNEGLPPGPIANVSLDALLAALNPKKTDCMYYFHDPDGKFYCSETYEKHVEGLKEVYGRGK